jgi:hypothetical protein
MNIRVLAIAPWIRITAKARRTRSYAKKCYGIEIELFFAPLRVLRVFAVYLLGPAQT